MNRDLSYLKNIEDFQKFIDENNIQSPKEFRKIDETIYRKVSRLGYSYTLKYSQRKKAKKRNSLWSKIKTKDDIQKFIDENNVVDSSTFRKQYNTLYQKAIRLGIKKELKFKETHFWRKLENFNSLDDFQHFIDENNILSPTDFKKIDAPLYRKASTLNLCDKLRYDKRNFSITEIALLKAFTENKIEYEIQKRFSWLKDKVGLKLDFYLPKYNVAVECQGKQHFVKNDYFGGQERFEEDRKRDLLKYNLCKENGITIIYFVDLTTDNFFGIDFAEYFGEVFFNVQDLLNKLNNITI